VTTEAGANSITEYLQAMGNSGCGMAMQVGDDESVSRALAAIAEKYAAPLVVVNNAGITRDNILMRMKPDEWNDVIDTNLNALYRVSKACLRGMTKARWGRIINITSVVGSARATTLQPKPAPRDSAVPCRGSWAVARLL
jgi:3-oxoacyl-[acyl-carrier protein] reductase